MIHLKSWMITINVRFNDQSTQQRSFRYQRWPEKREISQGFEFKISRRAQIWIFKTKRSSRRSTHRLQIQNQWTRTIHLTTPRRTQNRRLETRQILPRRTFKRNRTPNENARNRNRHARWNHDALGQSRPGNRRQGNRDRTLEITSWRRTS